MITVTVNPKNGENIYSLLKKKELALRRKNHGTLHASGPRRLGKEKWSHSSYKGWVQFQKCLSGVLVAQVQSRDPDAEWQLLSSFVGFLDRHFRESISSISLNYANE
jgi:hypothetical protein